MQQPAEAGYPAESRKDCCRLSSETYHSTQKALLAESFLQVLLISLPQRNNFSFLF